MKSLLLGLISGNMSMAAALCQDDIWKSYADAIKESY